MPDFSTMDIATLTRSITGEGVRYLQLFFQEYTALFPGPVNPSCPRCLSEYLVNYKKYYTTMANTSQYRLYAKYENIPLEFGSAILVNNGNMTDAYAQKLLEQPEGARFFAQVPEVKPTIMQQATMVKQAVRQSAKAKKKGSPQPEIAAVLPQDDETEEADGQYISLNGEGQ